MSRGTWKGTGGARGKPGGSLPTSRGAGGGGGRRGTFKAHACTACLPTPTPPGAAPPRPGLPPRLPPGREAPPPPAAGRPDTCVEPNGGSRPARPGAPTRGGAGRERRGRRPAPGSSALLGRAAAGTRPDWQEPVPSSSSLLFPPPRGGFQPSSFLGGGGGWEF